MTISDEQRVLLARLEREGLGLSKLLITLATGSVVLSVTALQFFNVGNAPLLVWAWIALVASIISGLIDRVVYIHGLSEHPLLVLTENDAEREYQHTKWLSYAAASEKISWLQILSFGAGILLFLIYAITSLT